jgi:hypothetical protein
VSGVIEGGYKTFFIAFKTDIQKHDLTCHI